MKFNNMVKALMSYYLLQFLVISISILKIPIIVSNCGLDFLGKYVALISIWQFVALLGDTEQNIQRISDTRYITPIFYLRKQYLYFFSISIISLFLYVFIYDRDTTFLAIVIFFLLSSILSIKTSEAVGAWEARGKLASTNFLTLASHLVSTGVLISTLGRNSIFLSFVITVFGNLFPGMMIAAIIQRNQKRESVLSPNTSPGPIIWNSFFLLQIVERASFVLDPLIIAHRLGYQETAAFSIYQKILIAFSITPTALSALAMRSRLGKKSSDSHSQIKKIIYLNAFALAVFFAISGKFVLGFLSQNSLDISIKGVLVVTLTGLIGGLASPTILSSVTGNALKIRVRATTICTCVSLCLTWILCPVFGFYASFLTSLASSTVVFVVIIFGSRKD